MLLVAPCIALGQPDGSHVNVVLQWNSAAIDAARAANVGAPMVSRALAVLHTCMYDAWAACDASAVGTQLGGVLRRSPSERTLSNKEEAIRYAAYRALTDLFRATGIPCLSR